MADIDSMKPAQAKDLRAFAHKVASRTAILGGDGVPPRRIRCFHPTRAEGSPSPGLIFDFMCKAAQVLEVVSKPKTTDVPTNRQQTEALQTLGCVLLRLMSELCCLLSRRF